MKRVDSGHLELVAVSSREKTLSAERKYKRVQARIKELDLARSIDDRLRLSNQLIQPLFVRDALPFVVDVEPVRGHGSPAVEQDAESYCASVSRRPHDQIEIPRVKAVFESSIWLMELDELFGHRPVALERPVIQR